ncbi:hypothetical protein NSU08_42915 [Paenibacillus sp. FSL H7-0331]
MDNNAIREEISLRFTVGDIFEIRVRQRLLVELTGSTYNDGVLVTRQEVV